MINPDLTIFIPNAFTPDEHNMYGIRSNNRFYVTADGYGTFNITILSRWGEVLYNSNNPNEGWDGKFKDYPVQEGVYLYGSV